MKKFTSLILVFVMLLAMLPMCFVTATADGATATDAVKKEFIGGFSYETVALYNTADPTAASGGWQHKTDEAGSQLAASGRSIADAIGVLIDIKYTELTTQNGYSRFKFKFTDTGNGATGGYYFGTGENASGFFDDQNWIRIAADSWEGTVFVPTELLAKYAEASGSQISVALADTKDGTWNNVRLAYAVAPTAPATLPDIQKSWDNFAPLFANFRTFTVADDAQMIVDDTQTNTVVFSDAGTGAFRNAPYGIMFTLDATQLDEGMTFDFALVFQVEYNGISTYLSTTPYGGANLKPSKSYTNAPEVRPDTNPESANWHSDWYLSYDGGEWVSYRNERAYLESESRYAGGRYAVVPNAGGKTVTVYVPMSAFWTGDGEQYLTTGKRPSGKENIVNYDKFLDIVSEQAGDGWELTGVRFDFNKTDGNNAKVKISNFCVVSCAHEWSNGTQISAPTHTEFGWQTSACSKCNTEAMNAIPKLPDHEWSDSYKTLGVETHAQTCVCGATKDPVAHTWSDELTVVVPPSHLSTGVGRKACTAKDCGQYQNVELPKLDGHDWTYTKIDNNQHKKQCQCGENKTEAHAWDDGVVTLEPTTSAAGVKTFTCVCGATKTEEIAKLSASAADDAKKDDGGCGSVIGSGIAMMAILSGAAVVLNKKRKK